MKEKCDEDCCCASCETLTINGSEGGYPHEPGVMVRCNRCQKTRQGWKRNGIGWDICMRCKPKEESA